MKKTLPIILIFIALTSIVGFMPLYFSLLQEIRGEVSLNLSSEADLYQLTVTDAEFNNPAIFSKSEESEFRYRGQMYDYKTVTKTNGGYIFYALQDDKESNLIDFLKATYSQSNENTKSSKAPCSHLMKNFSKDFVGCSSKQIVVSLGRTTAFFSLSGKTIACAGYYLPLMNPPDLQC